MQWTLALIATIDDPEVINAILALAPSAEWDDRAPPPVTVMDANRTVYVCTRPLVQPI